MLYVNTLDKKEAERSTLAKKVYSKPQLQVYGDLRTITQHVGNTGGTDAGNPGNPSHVHTRP